MNKETEVSQSGQRRHRNRKRSKRRGIYCLEHGCCLESVSPKRPLYADSAEQLRQRGLSHKKASMLIAQKTTVGLISEEWLEAFWCGHCYETNWHHVRRDNNGTYHLSTATRELWQQAQGVIHPHGNPSVGEFTRKSACMSGYRSIK